MVVVINGTNGIVAPGLTSEDSTGTTTLTTTTLVLGGTTITATGTELNYVDGVTSAIQTQLNAKVETLSDLSITATATELNYLDGASGSIQPQIDAITLTPQVITTNTSASAGNFYYLNGAGITLTLPASPSVGDLVGVSEVAGDTTSIVARNGSNIMSLAEDLTIDIAYKNYVLTYTGATVGWAFSG